MNPAEDRQIKIGVFAVLKDHHERILLLHRTDWDMWCLPGGLMEFGESVIECVERECAEELEVTVEVAGLIGVYSDPAQHVFHYRDGHAVHYLTLVFLASIVSGTIMLDKVEASEFGYFAKDNLPRVVPSHRVWIDDAFLAQSAPHVK